MADSGRTEQIISQLYAKALHAILSARIPRFRHSCSPDQNSGAQNRDRWFNLALGDTPPELEIPSVCQHGIMEATTIDIVLSPCKATDHEVIIERWSIVLCKSQSPSNTTPHDDTIPDKKTYKKSIVFLRSLYSTLRLLPAYRVFQSMCSSNQPNNCEINYKVSSFEEPLSREEEREFKHYRFAPVETQLGPFSVSVMYRLNLPSFKLDVSSPMVAIIITDYFASASPAPSMQRHSSDPNRNFHRHPPTRSTGGTGQSSKESRSFGKLGELGLQVGDFYHNVHLHATHKKGREDGSDDSATPSAAFDDGDFCIPFAIADAGSISKSSQQSQGAAIGHLFQMMKMATPIRSSSCCMTWTISNALEELERYREMKKVVLSRSGNHCLDPED